MTVTKTRTARSTWRPRLVAVVAVAVVNALVALAGPLIGADMVVTSPGQEPAPIDWPAFAIFSAGFALLGWAALLLVQRVLGADRGRLVWTIVAVLITVLMFLPPLAVGASTATAIVLELSHLVVAAIVIPVFWRTAGD